MHPQDFIDRWGVSRAALAHLLNRRVSALNEWLSAKGRNDPPPEILIRLDELHVRFSQWELEDLHLARIRQFYELSIRDQRSPQLPPEAPEND